MTRTRSPFLRVRPPHEGYQVEDLLDACTPCELSTASWGLALQTVHADPAWDQLSTKVLFVSRRRAERLDELVPDLPKDLPFIRFTARKLVEGAVARTSWAYLVGGMPIAAACALPFTMAVAPVLIGVAYGWRGWAIPAFGPSTPVDLESVHEVVAAVGHELELEVPDESRAIIEAYGFNPIPQFRRIFEHRA